MARARPGYSPLAGTSQRLCAAFLLSRRGARSTQKAMAMARPVITTDAPGCRETVIDGKNGFLVPVRDPGALAAAMERFILQSDLIDEMGQASRRIAEERFDVRKINQVILQEMDISESSLHRSDRSISQ
jgi:glycosyltransferase involved in cell wall biosynthesis